MKPAKKFAQVSRRFYRPEQSYCPICQRRLQRAVTLSERTVITLEEVIKLVHAGYRCPDAHCAGYQRTYRSVKVDALALPWFTNNDMERSIRGLKTRYRRVSGRKNWNAYLLRYGRCVAYAAWWEQDTAHQQHLAQRATRLDRARWRELRQETIVAHSEQLTRFRFRHKRQALLASLEERWATPAQSALLL